MNATATKTVTETNVVNNSSINAEKLTTPTGTGKTKEVIEKATKKRTRKATDKTSVKAEKPVSSEKKAEKPASTNKKAKEKSNKPAAQKPAAPAVITTDNKVLKAKIEAIKSLRAATATSKTFSGCIKLILSYWKDGYKDAFAFLNISRENITFGKIKELWAQSLINKDGIMLYRAKQYVYDIDKKTNLPKIGTDGKKIILLDINGKKRYEMVNKEIKEKAFTPMRIFEALLQGAIERGEIKL